MTEVITLTDGLEPDGMYRLHLLSNEPIARECPRGAKVSRAVEAGTHVLRAEWPYRGPCELVCPEIDWRLVVILWGLLPGDRISEAAVEAARQYRLAFGELPVYVWVERLPKEVEAGTVIPLPGEPVEAELENGLYLFDATFVPTGFLAVGRAGFQPVLIGS